MYALFPTSFNSQITCEWVFKRNGTEFSFIGSHQMRCHLVFLLHLLRRHVPESCGLFHERETLPSSHLPAPGIVHLLSI